MKKFLAVYIGTASAVAESGWEAMDGGKRKELEASGVEVWNAWVAEHKTSIVDYGAPLSKTKRISAQGISDISNNMAAYVIVQAESHEAAARMFEGHPHFMLFPGDSVEIMECLPLPGM